MNMKNDVFIRRLDSSSVSAVCELYRSIYGEDFPLPWVYDPNEMDRREQDGRQATLLAFKGDQLVGQVAAVRSPWNPKLFELTGLLVLPRFRGLGIGGMLASNLINQLLPELGWVARYTESTTAHDVSQRVDLKMKHRHCALALNLLPPSTYRHDDIFIASGRVSCVMGFTERDTEGMSPSYLPLRYCDAIKELSDGFDRQFIQDGTLPDGEVSFEVSAFPVAGTAYVAAMALGNDFGATLKRDLLPYDAFPATMLQLPLVKGVDRAVEEAFAQGFRLGGFLPRWFESSDGLLLQRTGLPRWDEIRVVTPKGQRLLEMVRKDRETLL